MLKINLITGAVSAVGLYQCGAVGGPLNEHAGPALGVLVVGELLENEVLTAQSADLREEHMK